MCDTLNVFNDTCVEEGNTQGEYVIISPYTLKKPQRGDIVIVKLVDGSKSIKRIIAIPEETVRLNNDGNVYIQRKTQEDKNSEEFTLDESNYLSKANNGNTLLPYEGKESTFKIPEDGYFLMGDNRTHSIDSRSCFHEDPNGCVISREEHYITEDNIVGKAKFVFWPLSHIRGLK